MSLRPASQPEDARKPIRETIETAGRLGESALAIARCVNSIGDGCGAIAVAASDRRALLLLEALRAFVPELRTVFVPGWDCLPYDGTWPSRRAMGQRIAALTTLAENQMTGVLIVTTPGGITQGIPSPGRVLGPRLMLRRGDAFVPEQITEQLSGLGYIFDERVDEPGEAALRGQVLDVFPAGSDGPTRVEHADGRVVALRPFDAATQLAAGEIDELRLLPISEIFEEPSEQKEDLLSFSPEYRVILDVGAEERVFATLEQIRDAREYRLTHSRYTRNGEEMVPAQTQYLTLSDWEGYLTARDVTRLLPRPDHERVKPPPLFAGESRPFRRFADFVSHELEQGHKVVLAAGQAADLRTLSRGLDPEVADRVEAATDWSSVEQSCSGRVFGLNLTLDEGFRDPVTNTVVVAAADVLGGKAAASDAMARSRTNLSGNDLDLRIGDVVVHSDNGLGVLKGIETLTTDDHLTDLVRVSYADDAILMVPVAEMGKLWRYGASADGLALDKLGGSGWAKRRAEVEASIVNSVAQLAAAVLAREQAVAPKITPPRAPFERFSARFPYSETPDQSAAIAATLDDLKSGHPMNRIVCGDVGFGKTEIALRAAAAVALTGRQVAVIAPTTVLVRQHVQTFERRFAGLGIAVGQLSRLAGNKAAKATKAGIANGSIGIVVGTHALAAKDVRFADLALSVIDEEQRFGAAHKAKLRSLAGDAHVLTLTATPIPRTLQAALVGLQDVSVITTPPAHRQPIRTLVVPYDEATVRQALLREFRRGGQSFVVCPRIEDIEGLTRRLETLAPELETIVVHGGMKPDLIDEAMVRFAEGQGDVLLATNIIESGLDVPRANTMMVWRPDRFGLAQLHQLRGRVGRGRLRGVAYLLTDPARPLAQSTRKRLETLASLSFLGAGFAISARDLDARGAGELFGEDQAGHVALIGTSLYQHLLSRALAHARGDNAAEEAEPELNIAAPGHIPAEYVPEQEVRINLYARLARLTGEDDVDSFEEEIRNRFGSPPVAVERLLSLARLRNQCRECEVSRVDAGPDGIALSFLVPPTDASLKLILRRSQILEWRGDRMVWKQPCATPEDSLRNAEKLLRVIANQMFRVGRDGEHFHDSSQDKTGAGQATLA